MNLKYSLPDKVEKDLICLAKKHCIQKVILFGSRARGDNKPTSDIDLAVCGGAVDRFKSDVDEAIETLLMFDIVNLDEPVQSALSDAVKKEGIIIYEKI